MTHYWRKMDFGDCKLVHILPAIVFERYADGERYLTFWWWSWRWLLKWSTSKKRQ